MKSTEKFISQNLNGKCWNWGQSSTSILKGKYKNENTSGEVKVYKLSKEEMDQYLKKFERK